MSKRKGNREKAKKFGDEFVKFATRGNMIDLAVGMIIGSAFTSIVNSLVNDLVMPLLSPLTGRLDFSNLFVAMDGNYYASLDEATAAGVALLKYGNFITLIINFIIVALCIFIMVRWINRLRDNAEKKKAAENEKIEEKQEEAPTTKTCPFCISEIAVEASRCPHCTSILNEGK